MTDASKVIFSFGIIADPQYADIAPRVEMDRYYSNSLQKLNDALEKFNDEDLSFVITLGDVIDRHEESFDPVLKSYNALRHRAIFVTGNHDYSIEPQFLTQVYKRLGMPKPYYSFQEFGYLFIQLDGNDVSLFAPPECDIRRELARQRLTELKEQGAINAQTWNASLSDEQFSWLQAELNAADRAGEKCIIFCHYPVYPHNSHNMWDAPKITELLSHFDGVVAWFCGHNHAGNYGRLGSTHFVTFKGMVDTQDQNAFAIADVYFDRIEIRGYGREENRVLEL